MYAVVEASSGRLPSLPIRRTARPGRGQPSHVGRHARARRVLVQLRTPARAKGAWGGCLPGHFHPSGHMPGAVWGSVFPALITQLLQDAWQHGPARIKGEAAVQGVSGTCNKGTGDQKHLEYHSGVSLHHRTDVAVEQLGFVI